MGVGGRGVAVGQTLQQFQPNEQVPDDAMQKPSDAHETSLHQLGLAQAAAKAEEEVLR